MFRIITLFVLLVATTANADVFRCTDEDGSVTFSQTPCSGEAERVSVSSGKSTNTASCKHAGHFSQAVTQLMRQGMVKADLLDEFGGADAFSRGSLRLVNYVYQYQNTRSMSQERIVSLATTQCETGTLGDVSCKALPEQYTKSGGGCGGQFSAMRAAPQANVFGANNAAREKKDREAATRTAEQTRKMQQQYEDRRRIDACQAEIQQKIDDIEMRIFAGSDPNGHRLELQRLRKSLGKCR